MFSNRAIGEKTSAPMRILGYKSVLIASTSTTHAGVIDSHMYKVHLYHHKHNAFLASYV